MFTGNRYYSSICGNVVQGSLVKCSVVQCSAEQSNAVRYYVVLVDAGHGNAVQGSEA